MAARHPVAEADLWFDARPGYRSRYTVTAACAPCLAEEDTS